MTLRCVVWGTGHVGRPAIRNIVNHRGLELAGVVVADPAKVGRDAGDLADCGPTGVLATDDPVALLDAGVDAVAYCASGDLRPDEAVADIVRCLRAGASVVTPSLYPLYHPASAPAALLAVVEEACRAGDASLFTSGVDPGWALDVLPLLLSGVCGQVDEIRSQEVFNYAAYHNPSSVRDVIGFGQPMEVTPLMLSPGVLTMTWGGMIRTVADGLGVELEDIREQVERRPLERTIEVPGMGVFEEGTQGAFRFEVQGIVGGRPLVVVEHVTRIDDDIAPDWSLPPRGQGCHRVIIRGRPDLEVTIIADDGDGNPAAGGNATAAARLVNAIPAVCASEPGVLGALDLPFVAGGGVVTP
jgi:2,4-diaminopentanoate dehydrogenase